VSTTTISVRDQKGLTVRLGAINQTVGETYYSVQPYAYWAKSGPLVVDYAVKPEPDPSSPTWWQERYGTKSDPAFILPWRYDPEKGNALGEEQKRFQTKDIVITPTGAQPGQVVTIKARIQNFSLLPTPLPLAVRFYVGNPAEGGIAIISTSGDSVVSTGAALQARGTAIVELLWQIPSSIGTNPRIYALLDQGNAIDEIHEANNVGWATLFIDGTATDAAEAAGLPTVYALEQNYPNPFNPSTRIRFSLPLSERASLTVYDVMGREVASLADGVVAAGDHMVVFDAGALASGVYFYRLRTPNFVSTKKLILAK